jgi:hypothetical protein
MNTKGVNFNTQASSGRGECSAEALSERLFERTLTFSEIVELSEKCGLWDIEKENRKSFRRPLTFVIPATQVVASLSRIVE